MNNNPRCIKQQEMLAKLGPIGVEGFSAMFQPLQGSGGGRSIEEADETKKIEAVEEVKVEVNKIN